MNKSLAILACIAMLLSTVGCGKDKKEKVVSSSEATTTTATTTTVPLTVTEPTTTTTEQPTPDPAIDKKEADKIANAFVKALTTGDTKTINQYYKLSELKAFDFLKNVKFAVYSISYAKNEGKTYYYKVNLIIAEDKSNTLKTGNQLYTLIVNLQPDVYFPPLEFYRADTKADNIFINYDNEIKISFKYECINDYFKGHSMSDIDNFYLECISFYHCNTRLEQFPADSVNAFIKSTFNVSKFDIANSNYYKKDIKAFRGWQTEGEHYIFRVISAKAISSDKTKLTIDYFADYSGIVKVKTVKYIVSKNVQQNNRVLSRTVISDSNLKVLIG